MIIECGHVDHNVSKADIDLEILSDKRRQRKYWIGPGAFKSISRSTTLQRLRLSFQWMTDFTDTQFIEVATEREALQKIYFANREEMIRISRVGLHYFALQHKAHSWVFTTDIDVSQWPYERFVIESSNIHEFGHTLGFNHTTGIDDLMNARPRANYPTPEELIKFQRRLGKSKQFWPIPQQLLGNKIRELTAERESQISIRVYWQEVRRNTLDSSVRQIITDRIRNEITPEIQRLHSEISQLSIMWNNINSRYKVVPGVN